MKQNCHFQIGLSQYEHAATPLSSKGNNGTLLKECNNFDSAQWAQKFYGIVEIKIPFY